MAKAKELPSGNWRAQASITVNGIKYRESFTRETERQANLAALQWQEEIKPLNKSVANLTLEEASDRYIKSRKNCYS